MAASDQRGVTMVELLVAMLLLAIALLGLASSFPYAMYGVVAGGYQTTATLLAQQSLEVAKATDYASLPSMATGGFIAVPGYSGFNRSVDVAVATSPPQYTTVTVVVRFVGTVPLPIYDTTLVTVIAN